MVPQDIIIHDLLAGLFSALTDSAEVQDVVLAIIDHLLSDFNEQTGHTVVSVIVSGDGMNHLNAVHQGRKGVLDGVGGSLIEGLDELLKSGQVLNIVLGLIKGLSDSEFDASPLGGGKVDLVTWLAQAVAGVHGSSVEHIVDCAAVLAA